MNRRTNSRRMWLAVALALPMVVIVAGGALQAQQGGPQPGGPKFPPLPGQPGGPGMPNAGGQPGGGKMQNTWTCTKCGKVAGTGLFAPNSCPHCGTQFINGMGGPQAGGKGGGNPGGPKPGGPLIQTT